MSPQTNTLSFLENLYQVSMKHFNSPDSGKVLELFNNSPASAEGWITAEVGRIIDGMKNEYGIEHLIFEAPYSSEMRHWADIKCNRKNGKDVLIEVKDICLSKGREEEKKTKRPLTYYTYQLQKCFEKMDEEDAKGYERWIFVHVHPTSITINKVITTLEIRNFLTQKTCSFSDWNYILHDEPCENSLLAMWHRKD